VTGIIWKEGEGTTFGACSWTLSATNNCVHVKQRVGIWKNAFMACFGYAAPKKERKKERRKERRRGIASHNLGVSMPTYICYKEDEGGVGCQKENNNLQASP
jgi:hypothetical protein